MSEPVGDSFRFIRHAKLVGFITFLSRIVGLLREQIAAHYFGADAIWSAWKIAFTIPNLFRKLLGEGALSAAFIPLYVQALRRRSLDLNSPDHIAFASGASKLLVALLFVITIVIELLLFGLHQLVERPDYLIAIQFAAIMLPYVMLVCLAALLSGLLQAHERFSAPAATSIVLNVCLIVVIVGAARFYDMRTDAGRSSAAFALAWAVLVAGGLQILILLPSLRASGFRLSTSLGLNHPIMRKLIHMTIPVAIGASVLQIGVLLDKGIAFYLSKVNGVETFNFFGFSGRLPMDEGAVARLDLAQFMYQFPLGVFAIALATAIFPKLAGDTDTTGPIAPTDSFREVLRRGIEASLFIGLPASVGMILVARPAIELLFRHGQFTAKDAAWCALSTAIYSGAIWAFSLLQIINRACYALHDTRTPLIWTIINLVINLIIELPLVWTGLGEAGMAVGTLVSFTIQAIVMTWIVSRRIGVDLSSSFGRLMKMIVATCVMGVVCLLVDWAIGWHGEATRWMIGARLATMMVVGAGTYLACVLMLKLPVGLMLKRRRTNTENI